MWKTVMEFQQALVAGTLIRRYQRFLADVELANGELTTVHCPDTGAMLGCCEPGSRVWMSQSDNPKRKYPLTWELVELPGGVLASIHAAQANRLVEEAIQRDQIPEFRQYQLLKREPRVADARLDFLMTADGRRDCYLEVKSVTAAAQGSIAMFPDAVSVRARRHLEQLTRLRQAGHRSVLLFCVKRNDMKSVRPATEIDPVYTETLKDAISAGVEVMAWSCRISTLAIELDASLPFRIAG